MDPSAEAADVFAATEQPEQTKPESKPRKKRSTNEERFKGIPVKKMYLELSADECICRKCGVPMEKIGTEFVRRELEIIPARARVIEYYSVNYGCKNCRQKAVTPTIIKARMEKHIWCTVWHLLPLWPLQERTLLIQFLKENGVSAVFHYIPLHSAPAGKRYARFHGEDKYTTKESERLIRLPMYYELMEDEVYTVADTLRRFWE